MYVNFILKLIHKSSYISESNTIHLKLGCGITQGKQLLLFPVRL